MICAVDKPAACSCSLNLPNAVAATWALPLVTRSDRVVSRLLKSAVACLVSPRLPSPW